MLLGLDSTDSVQGGCTTHVMTEVWRKLARFGVRGGPRLVRLNPNVPYKTRGNGALALDLGHGVGRRRLAGIVRGVELWAYPSIEEPTTQEREQILRAARDVVEQHRSPTSNTGLVAFSGTPDPSLYHAAVTTHVAPLQSIQDASSLTWGDGRGLVGAVAAAAWPGTRGTYELIAYREPARWGTRRNLPLSLGAELDARAPSSFDNWDPIHRHLRVAPASPCPILAGVRGTRADELARTLPVFGSEPVDAWMTFLTNQASGDHLRPLPLSALDAFESATTRVRVRSDPTTQAGGHVFVRVEDEGVEAVAAAYEPTKALRDAVRGLREGDEVVLEASVHDDPRRLALEAIALVAPVPRRDEVASCACGGAAASKGRRAGRACTRCGNEVRPRLAARASPGSERVTVPVCIRRHLSTPPMFSQERLRLPAGGIAA